MPVIAQACTKMSKVCKTSKGDAKAVSGIRHCNDPSIPMVISTSVDMRRCLVCEDTEPTCRVVIS
eukprot:4374464-Amphidinium_carterae.1